MSEKRYAKLSIIQNLAAVSCISLRTQLEREAGVDSIDGIYHINLEEALILRFLMRIWTNFKNNFH